MNEMLKMLFRLEKARNFYADEKISKVEKERYIQNLYDLMDEIDEEAWHLNDKQIDEVIELITIIIKGGEL